MKSRNKIGIAVLAVGAAAIIGCGAMTYANTETFMKGTTIGGVDVSKMNTEEAGKALNESFRQKTVNVKAQGKSYTVKLNNIAQYDGTKAAEKAMSEQNGSVVNVLPFAKGKAYSDGGFTLNRTSLQTKISAMSFMKSADAPKNARVSYSNGSVNVIAEHNGTQYILSKVVDYTEKAVTEGKSTINLASRTLMKNPAITTKSASVAVQKNALDRLNGHKIVLNGTKKGKVQVVLDSARYMKYVTADSSGNVKINETWLKGYARSLTSNFGTLGQPVTFTMPDGKKITVPGGTYGKTVNTDAEFKQLKKDILSGQDVERNVSMKTSGNDTLGKTFILLNIGAQKVTGYKNGKKVLESDVVTGRNDTPDRRTTRGAYYIFHKRSPAVLKGPGYASPVHVFAAFHNGQGFHDADGWRSVYGGSIYQHNGSHGCCNMPLSAARKLYSEFGIGTPVMVI